MKQRSRAMLTLLGVTVCLAAGSGGCGRKTSDTHKVEYRMQVNVGPRTAWGLGAARFAELVKEKTGGRINVKPYYNSELLRGAQLLAAQMVARGNVDCALESTINLSPVLPSLNVFVVPFAVNTYERLDCLESGETGRLLFEQMREKGLEPLAWGENGFRQITNSRRPIRSPEDLRGLRIRVVGSPIFVDVFRAFGADPVNMNWGDAITAFQQGTVDGQENPVGILLSAQIHEFHRYATFWNYACDPLVLYWCKRDWEAFPPEIQDAIRSAAQEACAFQKALARAGTDDGVSVDLLKRQFGYVVEIPDPVAYLREKGMEIEFLSDENVRAFKAVVEPVRRRWKEMIGRDVTEAVRRDWGEEL